MFQLALLAAGGDSMGRVLQGTLRNMGHFRLHLGLVDYCNGRHSLDEVGSEPLKNARLRLAFPSHFCYRDLLCTPNVSLSS